jgi:hypothetical protein
MKTNLHRFFLGIVSRAPVGLATSLLTLGLLTAARAQTGGYTQNGGSATLTSFTTNTSTADQSGIFAYNSGSVTVDTVNITTSGNASSADNAGKYGVNAGILAGTSSSKGTVLITGASNQIMTSGSVANGLFATYSGSSITMVGGKILASGANAHGVDVTYGGSITLSNVNVTTWGGSSSAIATDFGGGTVKVTGGTIIASNTTANSHSAGIYSTGTITVNEANVRSMADCGGVIDGANSIILTNTIFAGALEGIKLWKTAPVSGNAVVTIKGGSLTAAGGNVFYVTGTTGNAAAGTINVLGGASLAASTGNLVKVDSSSSATFTANGETLTGNLYADSTSTITANLQNGTSLTGSVNRTVLTIDATSLWAMTSNSVLTTTLTNSGTVIVSGLLTTTNVLLKPSAILGGVGALSSNLTVQSGATLVLDSSSNIVVGGNVIFGGNVTVAPASGSIAAGTYRLLTYAGSLSGSPVFTYSAPAGSGQSAVFNTATAGVITVTISAPPSAPSGLTASAGDAQVSLAWSAASTATGYMVKRSTTDGGPYTVIAANLPGLVYTNTGLANGALYYFVIAATNSAGESPNSIQVAARPVCPVPPQMGVGCSGGQLRLNWPVDHTGWTLQVQTNSAGIDGGTNWAWATVSDSGATNQVFLPANMTNRCLFFRLVCP